MRPSSTARLWQLRTCGTCLAKTTQRAPVNLSRGAGARRHSCCRRQLGPPDCGPNSREWKLRQWRRSGPIPGKHWTMTWAPQCHLPMRAQRMQGLHLTRRRSLHAGTLVPRRQRVWRWSVLLSIPMWFQRGTELGTSCSWSKLMMGATCEGTRDKTTSGC